MKEKQIDLYMLFIQLLKKIWVFFIVVLITCVSFYFIEKNKNVKEYKSTLDVYIPDTVYISNNNIIERRSINIKDAIALVKNKYVVNELNNLKINGKNSDDIMANVKAYSNNGARIVSISYYTSDEKNSDKILDTISKNYIKFLKENFGVDNIFIVNSDFNKLEENFSLRSVIKKGVLLGGILSFLVIAIVDRKKYIY
ncbi:MULTISPECIES: YveK family protein [Helcococcus]|uniref:Polysaccharide chain length determinant N-terminal domain-containing protein n=1 Tax=Helcococcus bovis TaxID=3153252 RepID=A0ABW9F4H1_9FIRM